jgi:hypothetical protein
MKLELNVAGLSTFEEEVKFYMRIEGVEEMLDAKEGYDNSHHYSGGHTR